MKTALLLPGLLALGFTACDRNTAENSHEPASPPLAHEAPAERASVPTPSPAVEPNRQIIPPVSVAAVWTTSEARDWDGKWTRRGNSPVFDIHNRNHVNGQTETLSATVVLVGNRVTGERSDGVHYRGTLSADGTQIVGTVSNDRGGSGPWIVKAAPELAQAPKPPRLAPEGIFFLLRSASVTTDSGIIGLHPGTVLRLLRDDGETLHVAAGDAELDVSKSEITNDFNVAEAAFANHAIGQANLAQWRNTQTNEETKQQLARERDAERQRLAVEQNRNAGPTTRARASAGNRLDQDAYTTSPLAGNQTSSAANYRARDEIQEIQRKNQSASNTSRQRAEGIDLQATRIEMQINGLQKSLNSGGRIAPEERRRMENEIKIREFEVRSLRESK